VRALTTPIAIIAVCVGTAAAAQGGTFDGSWAALIPPQDGCNGTSIMTLTMSGAVFQGQTRNPGNTEAFSGAVDADGSGTFIVYPRSSGTIRFTTDHFDANWNDGRCRRHALGDRALTAGEAAAAYTQRKQSQTQYAELTRKATAGDRSVDFSLLRALYPFTDQWDPYGNKTAALLDQAAAASKGKDCPIAMQKLDAVLKLDFTIDAAHALLSDCLAATGSQAAAKIESDIADGLIHSLMDSGDGNTEATAYVVTTQREELDVLANRHLVLKLRETQIRGSNGRLYDEVQAAPAQDGQNVKTVYFDVSSFANGRKSRMAAIETLTASMP
jgi:hypothetical protein